MSTININYTDEHFDPTEERERRVHLLNKRQFELIEEFFKIGEELEKLKQSRNKTF